jgi:hypothetical protein
MQLLSKGLKNNLHHKHGKCIKTLALKAERAINQLSATEQNYYRHTVAKNLKNISQKSNVINKKNTIEWKTISNIKRKMDSKPTHNSNSRQRKNNNNTHRR